MLEKRELSCFLTRTVVLVYTLVIQKGIKNHSFALFLFFEYIFEQKYLGILTEVRCDSLFFS